MASSAVTSQPKLLTKRLGGVADPTVPSNPSGPSSALTPEAEVAVDQIAPPPKADR